MRVCSLEEAPNKILLKVRCYVYKKMHHYMHHYQPLKRKHGQDFSQLCCNSGKYESIDYALLKESRKFGQQTTQPTVLFILLDCRT